MIQIAGIQRLRKKFNARVDQFGTGLVRRGVPAAWLRYRWVHRETVPEYFARHNDSEQAGRYETIHPEAEAKNPLPCNVTSRDELPNDRGWWGYSFWDVPQRTSGETFVATIPECRVVWYNDPAQEDDFYPAILTGDQRALDLREVRFRPLHAEVLRRSASAVRLKRATWITERVYHNHSHWLTAHLPKLLLLRERGELGDVLLPPARTTAINESLSLLGMDPREFRTFDPDRPLEVAQLTLLGTDRFRPELLRMVPQAYGVYDAAPPHRRVFISRAKAARRRLVNEEEVWSLLEPLGFERVRMEDLSFEHQIALMKQTAVLFAPHGAGLTNMMFCPPGAHVVEIADLSFPNPNFYALASALGHRYWLLSGESLGDCHPLYKDLRIDTECVEGTLQNLLSGSGCACESLSGRSPH